MQEDRETTIVITEMKTELKNLSEAVKNGFSSNKEDHDSIRRNDKEEHDSIQKDFSDFKEEIKREYITKKEVEPLINIYGSIQQRMIYLVLFMIGIIAILFEVIIKKINI